MYICKDDVCAPCCAFYWYCSHGKYGEPVKFEKVKSAFDEGCGYCEDFRCRLHEQKPDEIQI